MLKASGLGAVLLAATLFFATPARAADEAVKSAIGGLSASCLVQTYFNIGLLADASVKDDADKEQLEATLKTVEGLLASTQKHLDELVKSDFDDEDKAYLKKIKVCTALLDEQISALHKFWKEKNEKNVKAFDTCRQASWAKITETLGIK